MKEIKLFKLGMTFKKRGGLYTFYKIKLRDLENGTIYFQFYSMHYTMQADSYINKLCLNTEDTKHYSLPMLASQYGTIDDWEEEVEEEFEDFDDDLESTFYIYENKKEFERDIALS